MEWNGFVHRSPDRGGVVVEVPENEDWITSTDVQVDRCKCLAIPSTQDVKQVSL